MEIAVADYNEEKRMRDLYDASLKGCVSTLNTLLQQDPLILHRLSSQTTFFETPLHISALLGNLQFTKTLLSHKPKLALELDSSQRTPLHLASAEGHIDIVKELLQACGEACLVCDQEHRIPPHYAVIRGRRVVVLELIGAKPESLTFLDDKGRNILHLCVMHNKLEILKDLVALDKYDINKLLIEGDLDGNNTILHLAVILKRVETVSYLISIPKIRSEALNLKNNMGYTAADIVEQVPMDSKSYEIQVKFIKSGIKCAGEVKRIDVASEEDKSEKKNNKKNKWWWIRAGTSIDKWLMYKGKLWAEEMRGNLSLVATVLATISFEAALNPPGGVVQQGIDIGSTSNSNNTSITLSRGPLGCWNYKDVINGSDIGSTYYGACPGKAMLAYREPNDFRNFIIYNTISFVASMIVVLLLVSGVPLTHTMVMRVLSIGMFMAVTCLLNAYFSGLSLVVPYTSSISYVLSIATWFFNCLNALAGMYVGVTSIVWAAETLKEKSAKHRKSREQGTWKDTSNA